MLRIVESVHSQVVLLRLGILECVGDRRSLNWQVQTRLLNEALLTSP